MRFSTTAGFGLVVRVRPGGLGALRVPGAVRFGATATGFFGVGAGFFFAGRAGSTGAVVSGVVSVGVAATDAGATSVGSWELEAGRNASSGESTKSATTAHVPD